MIIIKVVVSIDTLERNAGGSQQILQLNIRFQITQHKIVGLD